MKGIGLYDPEYEVISVVFWLIIMHKDILKGVNEAVSSMDKAHLETLGPLARVLNEIILGTEERRADKIKPGLLLSETSILGNFNSMLLLYFGSTTAE